MEIFKGMQEKTVSGQTLQRTLHRRDFLAIAGTFILSAAKLPAFAGDVESLARELESTLRPKRGDSLASEAASTPLKHEPLSLAASRQLFLTFDDGPLVCTARILDSLAASGHRATFFVIGRNLQNPKLRDLAVRALKEGHNLGNHSYTHPNFSAISARRAEQEISATHSLIEGVVREAKVTPDSQKRFFRFPYGVTGSAANYFVCRQVLAALDYKVAGWDLDTSDWRMDLGWWRRSFLAVIASLNMARPLDVVLLHDRERTSEHLPEILEVLGRQRLVSVPLSDYEDSVASVWNKEREEELDLVSPSRSQAAKRPVTWGVERPWYRERISDNLESPQRPTLFAIRHPLETDRS